MANYQCNTCSVELTRDERRFYGNTCDKCARVELDQVEDWRHGLAEAADLESAYADHRLDLATN